MLYPTGKESPLVKLCSVLLTLCLHKNHGRVSEKEGAAAEEDLA